MKNLIQSTTELALHIATPYIKDNAILVDATCGNGHDTLALAKAINFSHGDLSDYGNSSACPLRLLAFDIQQQAIDATGRLLGAEGFGAQLADGSIKLIKDSHENIELYLISDTEADSQLRPCLILFNLGYLPGGDKRITTSAGTTITAIKSALELLAVGGLVSITMYSGHEEGAKEKAEILAFARNLDSRKYHVAYVNMANQPNNPPELLLITRKR